MKLNKLNSWTYVLSLDLFLYKYVKKSNWDNLYDIYFENQSTTTTGDELGLLLTVTLGGLGKILLVLGFLVALVTILLVFWVFGGLGKTVSLVILPLYFPL